MRFVVTAAVMLWIAGGLQTVASRFGVLGATPDFVILATTCLGMFGTRRSATAVGFAGGLIEGAVAGANLGGYILSRTITNFGVGWIASAELNRSFYVAPFLTMATTVVAQTIFLFAAAPPGIGSYLLAMIGAALYNGALALPVFLVLRRILEPPRR